MNGETSVEKSDRWQMDGEVAPELEEKVRRKIHAVI